MDKFSWKMIVNPLYWFAFLIFVGRRSRRRTYQGIFPGVITVPLGFVFSVIALIATHHLVGSEFGIGWYGSIPAALVASALTGFFLWPIAYSVADIFGDGLGHITRGIAEWVFGPVVAFLRRLPVASALWKHVEGEPEPGKSKRKWFTSFLMGATYVVGTLACGYAGYLTTEWLHGVLAHTILGTGILGMILAKGWIVAGFAGVIVARLLWQPLYDTLNKAEVNGLTFIWSAIVGYHGAILFGGSVLSFLGLEAVGYNTLLAQIGTGVGTFALNAALVFPIVLLFFNEGLKRFGEWIKPLLDKVYSANKNDFRLWFHHVVNIIVAIGLSVGAFLVGGKLDWNIWLTGGFTALTLVASYLSVVHVIKHNGGNAIIGFLTSTAVGFAAFDAYGAYLGWLGWLGGVIAGVFAAALWGLIILPGIYRGLELTIGNWFKTAGAGLDSWHKAAYEKVKKAYEFAFKRAQEETYRDKTEFKPLFGQVSNVLFALAVFATAWFYGLPHAGSTVIYWLAMAATVLVTFTSYVAGGKLAKNDGGEPLIVLLSIGAALYVGAHAFNLLPWAWYWALPTAAILAIVAGYGMGLFVIPLFYAGLKWLVLSIPDKASGGWKAGIANFFAVIHGGIYDVVDARILKPIGRAVDAVARVLAPIIMAVSKAYNDIMARIDRIFGKGKRA